MAIRRRFASVPPMYMSTKRSKNYAGMPSLYPVTGMSRAARMAYDTRAEDYLTDRVTNASFFSNYALDEGYDTAKKSRGRDERLLRDATHAINRGSALQSKYAAGFLGPRRFPRRFGKPTARKNKSSTFYGTRLARRGDKWPSYDIDADIDLAPSGDWRNYARAHSRARSVSVARTRFEDDALERPTPRSRAQSVGPSPFIAPPPSFSRRSLSPLPVRESIYYGMPFYEGYDPLYVEYEPNTKPVLRRRPRVLASALRPAGNYYDRLLRRRGRSLGHGLVDYDLESSLRDSNVTGALRRIRRANDYSGASLLLNVEGSGLSSAGKRVGFTYTPPPIPLFGRSPGVDERLLSNSTLLNLDSFLSGHVARMGALRSRLNDEMETEKARRWRLRDEPLEIVPRPILTPIPYYNFPVYDDYVPINVPQRVKRVEPLPMAAFKKVRPDGQTQRLDVIPVGNIKPRLSRSRSAENRIPVPATLKGHLALSVLDKINIKAAIIASKIEADPVRRRRPRSEYAAKKYRAMSRDAQEGIYTRAPQSFGLYASNPPLSAPAAGLRTKVLSKVVVRQPGSASEQVMTIPYETARRKSRFLGKPTPVKYFPSPYDFPDPRLNVPKRGKVRSAPKEDDEDGVSGADIDIPRRSTVKIPSFYACGVDPANPPMSDLRRRIRRTLNKTRRSSFVF